MSACHCCPESGALHAPQALTGEIVREVAQLEQVSAKASRFYSNRLFNWISVLLMTGWVGIVAIAIEKSGSAKQAAAPTLEAFLGALL